MAVWDKQPNEPELWFDRFERFRLIGPTRTIEAVHRLEKGHDGTAPGRWRTEAAKWHWRERAIAWDDTQREKARTVEESELEQRRKAWVNQALSIQSVGIQALLKLQDLLNADDADITAMSPRDILAYLDAGVKLELLARGQATEITQHEHSGTVTVEQRRTRLVGILDSLRNRSGISRN